MPPTNTRIEWPKDLYVTGSYFHLTGEPPVAFKARDGRSYIDLTTKSRSGNTVADDITASVLKDYIGREKVSVARLWSTGLYGLIKNPKTNIWSVVKLFKVDLATSQDSLESRVPYVFYNKFTPRPYNQEGDWEFHFLTSKRSNYSYKTATQLNEWIQQQREAEERNGSGLSGSIKNQYPVANLTSTRSETNTLGDLTFELKLSDYLTISLPWTASPLLNTNWQVSFNLSLDAALKAKGIPEAEIREFHREFYNRARAALFSSGSGSSGSGSGIGGGSTRSSGGASPPSTEPISPNQQEPTLDVVLRLPSGGTVVNTEEIAKLDQSIIKPQIRQAYTDSNGDYAEDIFIFDYIPGTVSYTIGGSVWNEIPRTYDTPVIEWTSSGLTRVQMTFLLAGKRLENITGTQRIVPDGINIDVENKIFLLRKMASRTAPVVLYGLDDIFNIQLQQAQATGVPCNWAITDLAITAKRRVESSPSLISVAQVNISFIEFPVERTSAFAMPKLKLQNIPTPGSGSSTLTPIRPDLWTKYLMKPIENALLIEQDT